MASDRLLESLLDGGVEFVVIGGVAAVLHGSTLLTRDLHISTDEGRLDCLGFVTGVGDYAAALRESAEINLGRQPFRVLGIDALIRSKEAAGRSRDLEAVMQLKAIREQGGSSE